MSRHASVPPTPPPTKEEVAKARALSPLPNGQAHHAASPAPALSEVVSSPKSPAPVPEEAPSPAPAPEPDEKKPKEQKKDEKGKEEEEEEEEEELVETTIDETLLILDLNTFDQILELDEDDESREFSATMVQDYFEQAKKTFDDMDKAFEKKDLGSLSSLGHFLKGSSAALGLSRMQKSCEKIQHYGHLYDEEADRKLSDKQALGLIGKRLARVKVEYREAATALKEHYKTLGYDGTFEE